MVDLKRIRFFMINRVDQDAELEKKGTALGSNKEREEDANLFAEPKKQAMKYRPGRQKRGPGGMIPERKKK